PSGRSIGVTPIDRARSSFWHARNKAYREWIEANRELIEYLATSPDVPDHLRPAGSLPPQPLHEQSEVRPDAISRPDARGPARPAPTEWPGWSTWSPRRAPHWC